MRHAFQSVFYLSFLYFQELPIRAHLHAVVEVRTSDCTSENQESTEVRVLIHVAPEHGSVYVHNLDEWVIILFFISGMLLSNHVPGGGHLHQHLVFSEPTALFEVNFKPEFRILQVLLFTVFFVEVDVFDFVNALQLCIASEDEFD